MNLVNEELDQKSDTLPHWMTEHAYLKNQIVKHAYLKNQIVKNEKYHILVHTQGACSIARKVYRYKTIGNSLSWSIHCRQKTFETVQKPVKIYNTMGTGSQSWKTKLIIGMSFVCYCLNYYYLETPSPRHCHN